MLVASKISDVIQSLGTADFNGALFGLLSEEIGVQQCVAFGLEKGDVPVCIVAAGNCRQEQILAQTLADEYTGGGFKDDPVAKWMQGFPAAKKEELTCIKWDDVPTGDFRKRFYEYPRIGHEAIIRAGSSSRMLHFCVFKSVTENPFDERELDFLRMISPIVISSLTKQFEMAGPRQCANDLPAVSMPSLSIANAGSREARLRKVREILMDRSGQLTQREGDICAHIVIGFTTLAISLNMGITVNTVATHRKRAYAKLGISSQTELFGLCVNGESLMQ